jgi:polyisoprenoid-binding protein YceI
VDDIAHVLFQPDLRHVVEDHPEARVKRKLSAPSFVKVSVALAVFAAMLLSACAAPAPDPTGSAGSATAAPQATIPATAVALTATTASAATSAVVTTTMSTPTDSPVSTATPAAPTVPAPAQSSAVGPSGGARHLVLVAGGTQARFKVREQLAGRNLPNDAVGTTNAVSGNIDIGADGVLVPGASKITVDMTSLKTDESRRDNFIKRNTLNTAQYPTAVFVPTAIKGLPSPLPSAGDVSFELTGDLTIHSVTKPITWQATGKISGQDLTGTASTKTTFEEFGMTPPRAAIVLSVEDNITLEIDFHLTSQ